MKSNKAIRQRSRPDAALTEPGNSARQPSARQPSAGSVAPSPDRQAQAPKKPATAKSYKTAPRSYRFQRARTPGIVEVLDENYYVMAEYSERTGTVQWHRVVIASQREQIEKWLGDHYPKA